MQQNTILQERIKLLKNKTDVVVDRQGVVELKSCCDCFTGCSNERT